MKIIISIIDVNQKNKLSKGEKWSVVEPHAIHKWGAGSKGAVLSRKKYKQIRVSSTLDIRQIQ